MTPREQSRAILAIASALNSTLLYSPQYVSRPESVRDVLLGTVQEWFALEPLAASPFDQLTTLEYIRTESLPSLVAALDLMGKNPFSQVDAYVPDRDGWALTRWEAFVGSHAESAGRRAAGENPGT